MFLANILGTIMKFCYDLFNNYGIAIIFFTLISKFVLLPISIWVQKNSIKMIKMQPKINQIKIDYFGDKDKIADEQSKLFKKEKYNVFISLVPIAVQIILLLGLVQVINKPLTYIVDLPNDTIEQMKIVTIEENSLNPESSSLELSIVDDIQSNKYTDKYSEIENNNIDKIKNLHLSFCGINLTWIASVERGIALLIPILAGLSSLLLCIAQNKINVLQSAQSNGNKYGTLVFSVGLSLYLGIFVPGGVAIYWVFSNLFAIIQQLLLNIFINPKKYIDYELLQKTNSELKELNQINKKNKMTKEMKIKARSDYKKFFKTVNKHLVFYSESNGFYKYFKGYIEYILNNTNIIIHYITSDYYDNIFEMAKDNPQIRPYYIDDKRLITLMMKMDADVVVMTMPDLDNYHIKRSYVRKDIKYIFVQHSLSSINMTMRNKCLNAFDSILACGPDQYDEFIEMGKLFNLNQEIIKCGYPLIDDMIEEYHKDRKENKVKQVLIAPSWQKDNIIDLCLDEILEKLKGKDYQIIVRPHPQHVRHMKDKFTKMQDQYKDVENIIIQTDFSKNDTVFNADILITDWSSIALEYAFVTKKPVIFIDTPMKIMNPEYKKINIEPINIWIREKIGKLIRLKDINNIDKEIEEILKNYKKYQKEIEEITNEHVYNIGTSGEVGAKYIISTIQKKIEERRKKSQ